VFESELHARFPIEEVIFTSPLTETAQLRIQSGVLYLARYSALHKVFPVEMLEDRIRPALLLRQFVYYTDTSGVPAAFSSWAWLSSAVLQDVLQTSRELRADEYNCGDLPFFCEMITPFGHCRTVVAAFADMPCFKGRKIPFIRTKLADGNPSVRVGYLRL
jgi:hemolysin-activating ACP:hemolysin acyltransferase